MTTESMVYTAILWLSVVTILFMMMILYISHVEIKNSKKKLNVKLAMHYNHSFQRLMVAFDQYHFFKIHQDKTNEDLAKLFDEKSLLLRQAVKVLSYDINKNCAHNRYIFIKNSDLRSKLVLLSKELVNDFQDWVSHLNIAEESILQMRKNPLDTTVNLNELCESCIRKYDKMLEIVTDMYTLLCNDVYIDVLYIKKGLS